MTRPYPARKPPVTLECPHCGAAFVRAFWKVAKADQAGAKLYCSAPCAHEARRCRTPEDITEYHRAYRATHREKHRRYCQEWWVRNRDREAIKKRDHYYANLEEHRARARSYAASHQMEAKERGKRWPSQNPDRAAFHSARSNLAAKLGLKPSEIPVDIVEAHVSYLKIRRWVLDARVRDSGSRPEGENPERSGGVEGEARQSGAAKTAHRPNCSIGDPT